MTNPPVSKAYGWVERDPNEEMLRLKHFLAGGEYSGNVPTVVNNGSSISQWPAMGNNDYGDCVEAAGGHAIQVYSKDGQGAELVQSDQSVLQVYTDVTGFNPNNPNTDQGTDIPTFLNWWVSNPYPGGPNILGWASLDPSDAAERQAARYLFGGEFIGFNCPRSAETQFDAGQEWTVPAPRTSGAQIVGGHCIWIPQSTLGLSTGGPTWGGYTQISAAFDHKYVSETYVVFSETWVPPTGVLASGVDWNGLNAAVQEMFGTTGAFTGPTNPVPPPPPAPSNAVAFIQGIASQCATFLSGN